MKLTINELFATLKAAEFEAELIPGEVELPLAQILVPIGTDSKNHPLTLQIGLQETPPADDPDRMHPIHALQLQFLQFLVMLPAQVAPIYVEETQTVLNTLNAVIELPGFGILGPERQLFFRYTMLCNHHALDQELFIMTIGLIMYLIDTYLDTIEQIALGERKLSEIEDLARKTREEEGS